MVYQRPTALLDAARQAGATALGGLGMLVCQGALAVDIWTEGAHDPAPRDVMRAAAEAALARAIEVEEGR
jgi:shikimate dehydrogenase